MRADPPLSVGGASGRARADNRRIGENAGCSSDAANERCVVHLGRRYPRNADARDTATAEINYSRRGRVGIHF